MGCLLRGGCGRLLSTGITWYLLVLCLSFAIAFWACIANREEQASGSGGPAEAEETSESESGSSTSTTRERYVRQTVVWICQYVPD